MKKIKFIIVLIVSLSLASCYNAEIGDGLSKAEEIKTKLEDIKEDFKSINNDTISMIYNIMKQDVDTIAKYTNKFPDNKEWRDAYGIYSDAMHMAKGYFKKSYNKEIEYSEKQIADLKTDIESKSLKIDSIRVYLLDEQKAIEILEEKIKIHIETSNQIIDKYNRTKPIVNQYIDSLKTTIKH